MQSFKTFLEEQAALDTLQGYKLILKLADILKTECDPFLTESNGYPLYRGAAQEFHKSGSEKTLKRKSIRTDRMPRHSKHDNWFNWAFNALAENAFGIKQIRNSSLFCTGDKWIAQDFGPIHYVFPIGNFKYLWSPKVHDSYENFVPLDAILRKIGVDSKNRDARWVWARNVPEPFAQEMIDAGQYSLSNLDKAEDKYLKTAKDTMIEYFENQNYKFNTGLEKAIKSHNEIFIVAPGDYYTISEERLASALGVKPEIDNTEAVYKALLDVLNDPKI